MHPIVPVQIENLAEDIDFKATIKRDDVESASSDLPDLFAQPITDALAVAGLKAVSEIFEVHRFMLPSSVEAISTSSPISPPSF